MLTYGKTVTNEQKTIKRFMKKAPTADGLSVGFYDQQLYLVLLVGGKPLAKVPVDWAYSAVDVFIEDVTSSMSDHSH